MDQVLRWLFDSSTFTPHGFCLLWTPGLIWTEAAADVLIALSYMMIPVMLTVFVWKRRDLAFPWAFILFGCFITLCGTTHALAAITFWIPLYDLEITLKVLTAIVSIVTAVALFDLMPRVLALPNASEIAALNFELRQEMSERARAEDSLRTLNADLEKRVEERTRALTRLTETLSAEVEAKQDALAELRVSEAQLRQAQKMEAIGNVAGGMAHDFNNLLGVIIGNLDFAEPQLPDSGDIKELWSEALGAALRGADLTRSLLAYARRQPLSPCMIDVNPLVLGMHRILSRVLGEDIEISLELADDLWPVSADPSQIEGSIVNLCTNARDAMPNGGRLQISTGNRNLDDDYTTLHPSVAPGDYVMIAVADTGHGMPPDMLTKIFEPFFTTKAPGKGTGLGLSMVFGFVHQSLGHVTAYSEVGIGTRICMFLPRVSREEARPAQRPAPAVITGHGESVLVVEDNAALRRIALRQFNDLGYRTVEAESPAAARRVLESAPVDMLFTDIVMPGGMSGVALADEALHRWPDIKVLLTSGFSESLLNERFSKRVSSLQLLTKPYRRDELARAARAAFDG